LATKTLAIYPNPSKGLLQFEKPQHGYLTIYNTLGQAVYATILTGDNQLNIEKLAAGTYSIRLLSADNEVLVTKLVKE
jgi:hypothetical protein